MKRPAWAELVRSGLTQTRADSHRSEWFSNWASAGLGSLNWISMNSGGMNRASTGLASLDQASVGPHSCFCFECCSFPCCLFAQLWLRAPCYFRYSRLVVCCVLHVACVLYVACCASPVSRAARCVLPAGAQHVSSPLCISSRLLLCISDETVSRFRLFWQRIAVVNDLKEV